MIASCKSAALVGIEACLINIEVSVNRGVGYFITGLPDDSIKESFTRIGIAIESIGFKMPRTKIVANLNPGNLKKSGTSFDLPIALCILAASGQINFLHEMQEYIIIGELGLNGLVHPVKGAINIADYARKQSLEGILLPIQNGEEAALVKKISVFGISNLKDAIHFVNKEGTIPKYFTGVPEQKIISNYPADFSEIRGQENIKRALEIAAAGSHNLLMIGSPGSGKTMAALRTPSILPPLTFEEAIETTKIYSIASGAEIFRNKLITQRPFRTPHHTISDIGLSGGGHIIHPGEISLAHNGVLYLDELPEFKRSAIEILRQPLEHRKIIINRSRQSIEMPASFMLIASMNPCPCGLFGQPGNRCRCSEKNILNYRNRISAPILERIDIHVESDILDSSELTASDNITETSVEILNRVLIARAIQSKRFTNYPEVKTNAQMFPFLTEQFCKMEDHAKRFLLKTMDKYQISARSYHRILRVARTIADLAETKLIELSHVAEAIHLRGLDKPLHQQIQKTPAWTSTYFSTKI